MGFTDKRFHIFYTALLLAFDKKHVSGKFASMKSKLN